MICYQTILFKNTSKMKSIKQSGPPMIEAHFLLNLFIHTLFTNLTLIKKLILKKFSYLAKQTKSSPSPPNSFGFGFLSVLSPSDFIPHPQPQFCLTLISIVPKATLVAAKTNIIKTNFKFFIFNNNPKNTPCQISPLFFYSKILIILTS